MTVFHRNEAAEPLPPHLRGGVVAIGNFDGVHRGHRSVLERALTLAAERQAPAAEPQAPAAERQAPAAERQAPAAERQAPALVLTFEPHPRSVFRPEQPVFRITPAPLKARILEQLGFQAVIEYPFTADFSQRSAEDFIQAVLIGWLGVSDVVTGFDFHFGRAREGGPAFLMEAGARHGFGVTLVDAFRDENAQVISSSRIRDCIATGAVAEAAGLLGYRFTVEAPVIRGQQLGRTLGYPTANMSLPAQTPLKPGIYAVKFRMADGSMHDGVASFGHRPTVTQDGAALLETFVFDFSGDLYGQICGVSFFGYLRPEVKFDGLESLIVQMEQDCQEARALLAGVTPLGDVDRAICF